MISSVSSGLNSVFRYLGIPISLKTVDVNICVCVLIVKIDESLIMIAGYLCRHSQPFVERENSHHNRITHCIIR